MEGLFLRVYLHENQRCHGRLAWEWLLEQASKLGLRGGSVFRAMAGFGHHHLLHEDHFFELAGTLTVIMEFVVTESESGQLLELLRRDEIKAFYAIIPARFGKISPETVDEQA